MEGEEDDRVFYRDIKPYEAPVSLTDLRGPFDGLVEPPLNVYWGPAHTFDLSHESDLVELYQATLREGRAIDQMALLNRDRLVAIWAELVLPIRVRHFWETRFPELRRGARVD